MVCGHGSSGYPQTQSHKPAHPVGLPVSISCASITGGTQEGQLTSVLFPYHHTYVRVPTWLGQSTAVALTSLFFVVTNGSDRCTCSRGPEAQRKREGHREGRAASAPPSLLREDAHSACKPQTLQPRSPREIFAAFPTQR